MFRLVRYRNRLSYGGAVRLVELDRVRRHGRDLHLAQRRADVDQARCPGRSRRTALTAPMASGDAHPRACRAGSPRASAPAAAAARVAGLSARFLGGSRGRRAGRCGRAPAARAGQKRVSPGGNRPRARPDEGAGRRRFARRSQTATGCGPARARHAAVPRDGGFGRRFTAYAGRRPRSTQSPRRRGSCRRHLFPRPVHRVDRVLQSRPARDSRPARAARGAGDGAREPSSRQRRGPRGHRGADDLEAAGRRAGTLGRPAIARARRVGRPRGRRPGRSQITHSRTPPRAPDKRSRRASLSASISGSSHRRRRRAEPPGGASPRARPRLPSTRTAPTSSSASNARAAGGARDVDEHLRERVGRAIGFGERAAAVPSPRPRHPGAEHRSTSSRSALTGVAAVAAAMATSPAVRQSPGDAAPAGLEGAGSPAFARVREHCLGCRSRTRTRSRQAGHMTIAAQRAPPRVARTLEHRASRWPSGNRASSSASLGPAARTSAKALSTGPEPPRRLPQLQRRRLRQLVIASRRSSTPRELGSSARSPRSRVPSPRSRA